jgi:hypothetical protein
MTVLHYTKEATTRREELQMANVFVVKLQEEEYESKHNDLGVEERRPVLVLYRATSRQAPCP